DPAFGSSPESDRYVASVFRAAGSRLIQVAEYATVQGTMHQFAWVLAHLGGAYTGAALVLEIAGPGMAVWQELQRLAQPGWGLRNPAAGVPDVLAAMRHYLYARSDALRPQYAYQWKSTGTSKEWLLHQFRDTVERQALEIRSPGLVAELRTLRQDKDKIEARGRAKDDRVI